MNENNTIIIKKITNTEKSLYQQHLLDLDTEDRYMRFGSYAKDNFICKYVKENDLRKDAVFGAFTENLELVAAIHLFTYQNEQKQKCVEVALSVDKNHRKKGIAQILAKRAWLWCEAQDIDKLELQWLMNNPAISKMVKNFGGKIKGSTSEYDANISLEGSNLGFWKNWFLSQVEFFHYGWNYNQKLWKKIKNQLPEELKD